MNLVLLLLLRWEWVLIPMVKLVMWLCVLLPRLLLRSLLQTVLRLDSLLLSIPLELERRVLSKRRHTHRTRLAA